MVLDGAMLNTQHYKIRLKDKVVKFRERSSSILLHLGGEVIQRPPPDLPRRAILNKSWRQHPTRHQLYGHLHPITKTIQVRRTRHAGHCWRSRDELIRDVLLWTPTHGRAKAGRPARIYIQQLCEDTGCSPEDLPRAMNDREEWRERVRDIRTTSAIWWWWWWYHHYITLSARISLNLSRHTSLLSIASGRSSGVHPVSAQSCGM